jgi:N-acetylglucosaminyl-diphospho-decaprenol L-rhamnosyltransferase
MSTLRWNATQIQAAQGLLCVEFVTGACFVLRKALFDRVQGFDEAYFMYYEDEDLCLRLRRAGFSIVIQPTSVVQHFARTGGAQGGWGRFRGELLRGKVHTTSKLRFYRQYRGAAHAQRLHARLLAGAVLALPFKAVQALVQPKYLARLLGRMQALLVPASKLP